MKNIYSRITLMSGAELVGNCPPTHYRYHPLDDSRLIPIVSPGGRVTHVSIDAIAAIEIDKAQMNLNDEEVALGRNTFRTFARQAFGADPEQLVVRPNEHALAREFLTGTQNLLLIAGLLPVICAGSLALGGSAGWVNLTGWVAAILGVAIAVALWVGATVPTKGQEMKLSLTPEPSS